MTISSITTEGHHAAAPPFTVTGQHLQAVYVPTASAAGGVFMIVEKDTGRVIVQLPFAPQASAGEAAAAHAVDITA
ncbi:hypothetical protein [Phenylobacterium montanum]|uniref:Uncharacterized protein n=1 Tax=Phenylobacterium montanum TaxID=2823693 RepID=A0A975IWK4_9CAUL|nr:hypothetical protein [Caulobacter sp. S6]QUD89973.1 hypothetical protein KCG34_08945 [Caulobacter sp. S6]